MRRQCLHVDLRRQGLCEDIMRSHCPYDDTKKTGILFARQRRSFRRRETKPMPDLSLLSSTGKKIKWYLVEHSIKQEQAAF